MRHGLMPWNVVNTCSLEANSQNILEFLLVRWIVFVSANLKLSIKQGEGPGGLLYFLLSCAISANREDNGGRSSVLLFSITTPLPHYKLKFGGKTV